MSIFLKTPKYVVGTKSDIYVFITNGVGTADSSEARTSDHIGFQWGSCCSILSFLCRSLFVLMSFFSTTSDYPFGILDLRLLITPLVS